MYGQGINYDSIIVQCPPVLQNLRQRQTQQIDLNTSCDHESGQSIKLQKKQKIRKTIKIKIVHIMRLSIFKYLFQNLHFSHFYLRHSIHYYEITLPFSSKSASAFQFYMRNSSKHLFVPELPVWQEFTNCQLIGEGSFGLVIRAQQSDGKTVAVKLIKKQTYSQENKQRLNDVFMRELTILKKLDSPYTINLLRTIQSVEDKRLYLVMDYMPKDLQAYMQQNPNIPVAHCKQIIYQIIKGIQTMHEHKLMHRDLKPLNILIDPATLRVRLADFGHSRPYYQHKAEYSLGVSTLWYRAPQILFGDKTYNETVDIWAAGLVFGQLLSTDHIALFESDCQIDTIFRLLSVFGQPNEERWPGFKALKGWSVYFPRFEAQPLRELIKNVKDEPTVAFFEKMLVFYPKERPSAQQLVEDAYFDDIRHLYP